VVPSGGLLAEELTEEDKRKDGRGLLSFPSPPSFKRKSAHPIFPTHRLPTCLILRVVPLFSISATFADTWVFLRSPDRVQRLPIVRPPVPPFPAARKTLTSFAFRLLLLSAVAAPPAPALPDSAPARSDPADRGVAAEQLCPSTPSFPCLIFAVGEDEIKTFGQKKESHRDKTIEKDLERADGRERLHLPEEELDEVDHSQDRESGDASQQTNHGRSEASPKESVGSVADGQQGERGLSSLGQVDLPSEESDRGRRTLFGRRFEGLDLLIRDLDVGRGEVSLESVSLGRGGDGDGLLAMNPGD
jgi:hypothetical protein